MQVVAVALEEQQLADLGKILESETWTSHYAGVTPYFRLLAELRGGARETQVRVDSLAIERVTASVMKSLVVTDSIQPTEATMAAPNIRIVPTAPMFAQAILNTWSGTSVSSLFQDETLAPIYEGMYSRG